MTKISCSNGVVNVEKGLISRIEETWYGDQFNINEGLYFVSETGEEMPFKLESERVEPDVKTIRFHWPENDRIGIREGYAYNKTLRAHVSKKKMVDHAKLHYSTADDTKLTREMDVFFLKKSKFSTFGMNVTSVFEGGKKGNKGVFQWNLNTHATLSFLKKGLQYVHNPNEIDGKTLGDDTIWFGDTHYRLSNVGQLLAATTYQNNRTKVLEICIPEADNSPENIKIIFKKIQNEEDWKIRSEIFPILQFQLDLSPGQEVTFKIEFRFIFIPERRMNHACFIIPDSEEYWPCALACAVTIGEKREHFSALAPHNPRLNVLNPIMWYKEGEPLASSIYDYLLSLREIDKICLFGVPRTEDIQQLIILLLDRGSELSELDFYIFTKPENLKELHARKEEIAEVVLKAREEVDVGIIDVIKNMIKIHAIPNLLNTPLEFRKLYYRQEIISKHDRPSSEYLLAIPNDPCIASIIIPFARYLQAPVIIYQDNDKPIENLEEFITDFKGNKPLAITIYSKSEAKVVDQLKNLGYTIYNIEFTDENDLSVKIARIFEILKIFNWGFNPTLRSRMKKAISSSTAPVDDSEDDFLSVLMNIDSEIGKKYQGFVDSEIDGISVRHSEYLQVVLNCAQKHFSSLFHKYYEKWSHLEEVVFNSAVLCEKMEDVEKIKRRCNLLLAGNYAFYKNAPLIPINPTTEKLVSECRNFFADLDKIIQKGSNPDDSLRNFGNHLYNTLIPTEIDELLKIMIPNELPYFTVTSGVPLELIHDKRNFWGIYYSLGRMSGLDQYSTALQINLSVSVLPLPKEQLKILLIANPTLDLPDASKELVQLRQRLKGFEIETIEGWSCREHDIVMSINRGPNIIHYSGHGYMDPILPLRSGLILTDSRLTALEISHLKLWSNPLIFTNACLSAVLGTSFLHAGSCFFVSPLWSVTDFTALEYAYTFYSSIISGWALGEAQKIAKNLVQSILSRSRDYAHDFTWLAYSCVGEPSYSLIYTKPWEKQAFGEIIFAAIFIKQKSTQCARDKVIKKVFKKILTHVKQFAEESGEPIFDQILQVFEPMVQSILAATEDNWQSTMNSILEKLDQLDDLGKSIDDLKIQDRVRQLFGLIAIASRV
ncbi:MAG: CHAT domain-containing protein [Candidatus Helarchaeota archaeon]|nr:CHAT domain-containing protein [Candidatus Helarchaeota archaeon]